MTASLSNHDPSARPAEGFEENLPDEDHPFDARLRGLSKAAEHELAHANANDKIPRR